MNNKVIILIDSQKIADSPSAEELQNLELNTKDPINGNYCARIVNDDEEDSDEDEYIDDDEKEVTKNTDETEQKNVRIGYYAGLIKATFDKTKKIPYVTNTSEQQEKKQKEKEREENETTEENTSEQQEILLRAKSRFNNISVSMMLEKIMEDDEFEEGYLKTGLNKDEKLTSDSLYMIEDNPNIELDKYINLNGVLVEGKNELSEKDIDEIKKEYGLVCKCEIRRPGVSDKYKEELKTNVENNINLIRPYAINLALLFELYSRWYVKENMDSFVDKENKVAKEVNENQEASKIQLLKYVPDKKEALEELKKPNEDDSNKDDFGAKLICKSMYVSQDNSNDENDGETKDKQKTDDNEENIFYLDGIVVPDIVIWDEKKNEYYIYDVKYKDPTDKHDRDDRLQILAYAFMYNAKRIGHIFPDNGVNQHKDENFEVDSENKVEYKMEYISAISEPNPPH